MESQAPPPSDPRANPAPRKAYRRPQLTVYGDLTELTKGKSGSQTNDGTGHPNKHFTS